MMTVIHITRYQAEGIQKLLEQKLAMSTDKRFKIEFHADGEVVVSSGRIGLSSRKDF